MQPKKWFAKLPTHTDTHINGGSWGCQEEDGLGRSSLSHSVWRQNVFVWHPNKKHVGTERPQTSNQRTEPKATERQKHETLHSVGRGDRSVALASKQWTLPQELPPLMTVFFAALLLPAAPVLGSLSLCLPFFVLPALRAASLNPPRCGKTMCKFLWMEFLARPARSINPHYMNPPLGTVAQAPPFSQLSANLHIPFWAAFFRSHTNTHRSSGLPFRFPFHPSNPLKTDGDHGTWTPYKSSKKLKTKINE